jgi:hypothetical protein
MISAGVIRGGGAVRIAPLSGTPVADGHDRGGSGSAKDRQERYRYQEAQAHYGGGDETARSGHVGYLHTQSGRAGR